MLTPGEVATIKAEVERLEKALKECTDSGIKKRIEAWIEGEKQKLLSGNNPNSTRRSGMSRPILTCAICGKLVPLEEAKTDENSKPVHSECYAAKRARAQRPAPSE